MRETTPIHVAARHALRNHLLPYEGDITITSAITRWARYWRGRTSREVWPELGAPPHPHSELRRFHLSDLLNAIANAEYAGWTQERILRELEADAARQEGGAA